MSRWLRQVIERKKQVLIQKLLLWGHEEKQEALMHYTIHELENEVLYLKERKKIGG
ncbi:MULTISPECIES: hypothetical protein [Bacillus]|uniref:hypothetical protein n=1 Tax=Bacillus TaxID=1386 RepID=UPI0016427CD1|nr:MULTISPECIES: hypothetical protein [Bacillus]QRY35923.1 hypothetical protein JVX94_11390 [Bacillus sp. PDNC022]